MPLEDRGQLDLVFEDDDYKVNLGITDSGITTEPGERFRLLIEKVKAYIGYILSEGFQEDHPKVTSKDVRIVVFYKDSPTTEMLRVTKVNPSGRPEISIPVVFRHFPGTP
jgi:hypothetical protein